MRAANKAAIVGFEAFRRIYVSLSLFEARVGPGQQMEETFYLFGVKTPSDSRHCLGKCVSGNLSCMWEMTFHHQTATGKRPFPTSCISQTVCCQQAALLLYFRKCCGKQTITTTWQNTLAILPVSPRALLELQQALN